MTWLPRADRRNVDMIRFEYAADHGLLYIKIVDGPAAETIEFEESVYVDLDADGQPIGVEFLNAADFLPFLVRRGGIFAVPENPDAGAIVAAD
jgi:uncharacterized protein YuzE